MTSGHNGSGPEAALTSEGSGPVSYLLQRGITIAVVHSGYHSLTGAGDILDLMGSAMVQGASGMVFHAKDLPAGFFDLRTGLAGEVLQKFSTYGMRLAIVGDFSGFKSNALQAFIVECNRGRHILFIASEGEALERLTVA